MSIPNSPVWPSLGSSAGSLESLVAAFESAWQRGERPAIDDFLGIAEAARLRLLVELVHADLEYRLKTGEATRAENYLSRYPELAHDSRLAVELIVAEYNFRQRSEPQLIPQEYLQRFPHYAPELETRFRALPGATPGAGGHPAQEAEAAAVATFLSHHPRPAESSAPAPEGVTVAGYEILGELGRGAMGVVYKARQVRLNRLVALKMILAGSLAGEEERARFRREAEAVARLQHPNIVQLFEVGEAEGRPYFSLEFLDGGSLADKLDGTPRAPRQSAQLVEQLARAIQAAHESGIVHRDLKPGNVLVGSKWVLKITDFGLAKLLQGEPGALAPGGQTQSGAIMGTPSYMAPEQAQGKSKRIGPAADVYALGAILYELLTGRPPFKAATALDTILQVIGAEPVPPSRFQKVPRDLETICLKCLQKEPRRRYASALALAEDLAHFLKREPIQARPVGWAERAVKWVRRRPALAATYLLGVVLLVGGTVGTAVAYIQIANANEKETAARKDADRKAAANKQLARQEKQQRQAAKRESALLACDRALALCEVGDARRGLHWLARGLEYAEQAGDAPLELFLRSSLAGWRRQLVPLQAIRPHPGGISGWTCDGRTLLTWTARPPGPGTGSAARLFSAATGEPTGVLRLAHAGRITAAAFSPDGRLIATAGADGRARLWEAATGKPVGPPLRHPGWVYAVAFSPDGTRLLTGSGVLSRDDRTKELSTKGEARLWDIRGGRPVGGALAHPGAVVAVAFRPDGKAFLTRTERFRHDHLGEASAGGYFVTDAEGGMFTVGKEWRTARISGRLKDMGKDFQIPPGWSGAARMWDATSLQPIGEPVSHQGECLFAVFSPDSKALVTGGWSKKRAKGEMQLWDAATGKTLLPKGPVDVDQHPIAHGAFSPDGQAVAIAWDRTALLLYLGEGKGNLAGTPFREYRLLAHQGVVSALAFSLNGKFLATGSEDGTAQLWQAGTGQAIGESIEHPEAVVGVAFSSDGRTLATLSSSTLRVWDARVRLPDEVLFGPHEQPGSRSFEFAEISPDMRFLYTEQTVRGGDQRTVELFDRATGKRIGELWPARGNLTAAAFSPDGGRLATGTSDGTILLRDPATLKQVGPVLRHKEAVTALAFRRDGKLLVSGTNKQARVWDLGTGKTVGQPMPHPRGVTALAFSPDGRRVLTGCAGKARQWDAATGRPVGHPLNHAEVARVAFSGDGNTILTEGGRVVRLWQAASGKPVGRPFPADAAAFSPDGKLLLTGLGGRASETGELRLWSTATGQPMGLPLQHPGVERLAFAPDGRTVLSASWPVARLWDAALTRPLGPPLHHPASEVLAFSPDSRTGLVMNPASVRSWSRPAPVAGSSSRVRQWVQVITGMRLDAGGGISWLETDEWDGLRHRLQNSGAAVCGEMTMTAPLQDRRPRLRHASSVEDPGLISR
jgi:WD40 repeat protein